MPSYRHGAWNANPVHRRALRNRAHVRQRTGSLSQQRLRGKVSAGVLRYETDVDKIETTRSPTELLDSLQAIEQRLGRVKTVDKGPRSIDLDVLTYGEDQVDTTRLKIPHPLMGERDFVSRPLGE